VIHTFRPVQTLSCAAIESAPQAVWMIDGGSARECARRHVCLVLDDPDEQRKAAQGLEQKDHLKLARQLLLERPGSAISGKDIGRFPGYMNTVKEAAATVAVKGSVDADLENPEAVERLWGAFAGSAHGKRWPSLELQIVNPRSGISPGQFATDRVPDPTAITKILKLADAVLTYGILRFADYSGYQPQLSAIIHDAQQRLAAAIPRHSAL
jgi:hypothetical protein